MATYVVIGVILAVAVWMVVESIINKDKMSKSEFYITTGAGIVAGSLVLLSRLL
jgi:hypothetical protein